MKKKINGIFSSLCDKGMVRENNEDSVKGVINSSNDFLLVVCDGLGGHKKGEFASKYVVETLCYDFLNRNSFLNIMQAYNRLIKEGRKINSYIYEKQLKDEAYRGMGTTLVAVLIIKNKFILLNVGDSRCYTLKNGELKQLSEDQTYVNYLLNAGIITKEEALVHPKKHVLTNCIGMNPSFSCSIHIYDLKDNSILLCSDGLYNNVSFYDIEANINNNLMLDEKVKNLINLANYNGGSDNISCILREPIND